MIHSLSLREEILAVTHRWPLPLIAFLLGALIGVAATRVLPTTFRAESAMNVEFSGDLILRNPDDYKNGQLGLLNTFITSKDVLDETLFRLRKRDPYWNGVSAKELILKLDVYWRNVGEWRLVVGEKNPIRATQLAEVWGAVVLEKVNTAVFHADRELRLRTELNTNTYVLADNQMRILELKGIQETLQVWHSVAERAGEQRILDQRERWRLLGLVSRSAGLDPVGLALLYEAPPAEAAFQAYIPWIDESLVYVGRELAAAQEQAGELRTINDIVYRELDDALRASRGLTAHLRVQPLPLQKGEVRAVRTKTELALVGSLVGLLLWGVVWLGILAVRVRRR